MASNTFKQYASALRGRTIRIAPKPYPIHPFQRRAIIQILEEHSRIEAFRQDRVRRGFFHAILKDQAAVEGLLSRSPLKIQVPKSSDAVQSPTEQTKSATQDDSQADLLPPNDDRSSSQRFTIYLHPEFRLDLQGGENNNIYSYSWPHEKSKHPSFARSALQEVVPKGMTGDALAQWEFDIDPDWDARSTATKRLRMKQWIPSKMGESNDNEQDVDERDTTESGKPRNKRTKPLVLDDEDDAFLSQLRAARRDG